MATDDAGKHNQFWKAEQNQCVFSRILKDLIDAEKGLVRFFLNKVFHKEWL